MLGGVRYSVAAVDHRTGRRYEHRPGVRYESASLVKVDIVGALLARGTPPNEEQWTLAKAMIATSDNAAASALWEAVGGDSGLGSYGKGLELSGTAYGAHGWWGLTLTTARDRVRLLDAVLADGTAARLLAEVLPEQAWGVSAAARDGEPVLLKNGWDTRAADGDRWAVHSVGRVGPVTMAVMSDGHATRADGIAFVARTARRARQRLDRLSRGFAASGFVAT